MVATVGSIEVAFAADLRRYEAALRKGEKSTSDFERKAGKSVSGVGAQFVRLGGLAKAGLAGLAAGLVAGGVTGIVAQFGQVARAIADIGDQAKLAGLSVKAFGEWRYVAMQARIPVDAMADAFKELAIRADEFATTGKGSGADAFARLGLSPQEVKERLKDPAELMLLIIERTRQLGDTAAGIRVFDEIMGGQGGEQYVRLIDQGAEGIRRTIEEAHRLGVVMDDELIQRAAEVDRLFHVVATTVGATLKKAIVDAASGLILFIEQFRAFENMRTSTLDLELRDIGRQRLDLENQILKIRGEQADISDTARSLGFGEDSATVLAEIEALKAQDAALAEQEATILAVIEARRKLSETSTSGGTWTPPAYTPPTSGSSGRDKAAAAAEREAEAVRRLIDELDHELSLIGATDLQRDISNTLRDAGAAATDKQREKIVGLITALHAEAEAERQRAEVTQLYGDIANGVMSDLRSALDDGKLDWEDFGNVAINVLETVTDLAGGDVKSIISGKDIR